MKHDKLPFYYEGEHYMAVPKVLIGTKITYTIYKILPNYKQFKGRIDIPVRYPVGAKLDRILFKLDKRQMEIKNRLTN